MRVRQKCRVPRLLCIAYAMPTEPLNYLMGSETDAPRVGVRLWVGGSRAWRADPAGRISDQSLHCCVQSELGQARDLRVRQTRHYIQPWKNSPSVNDAGLNTGHADHARHQRSDAPRSNAPKSNARPYALVGGLGDARQRCGWRFLAQSPPYTTWFPPEARSGRTAPP